MLETKHHWLPIIIAVYLPVSLIITYVISVEYKHVEPDFPYISETGTIPPESCVFAQLLNIGAVLAGGIIYIKYRLGCHHFNDWKRRCLICLNATAFVLGMLSSLGVSIVANFQLTNIIAVHYIGAFLAFVVGLIYMILQTILSCMSASTGIKGNTPCIRRLRVLLCVLDTILVLVLIIAAKVAVSIGPGPGKSKRHWSSDDPGYAVHLVATISEWLMALMTVIYFATFHWEFKHFRMSPPEVVYFDKETQKPEVHVHLSYDNPACEVENQRP